MQDNTKTPKDPIRERRHNETQYEYAVRLTALDGQVRMDEFTRTGVIPKPTGNKVSWLDVLASHQHVGSRYCWQYEASTYARAERQALLDELERLRSIVKKYEN